MNRKRKIGSALAVAALVVVSTSYFELISPYMAELSIKADNGLVEATYEHNLSSLFSISNYSYYFYENTSSVGIGDGKASYLNGTIFFTGLYDAPFFEVYLLYQFNASFADNYHPTAVVASAHSFSGGKAYNPVSAQSFINSGYLPTDNVSFNRHSLGGNSVTFHLTNGGILHHGKTKSGIGLPDLMNQSAICEFHLSLAKQNFVHNMTVELTLTTNGAPVPLSDTFDFYVVDPGVK